MQADGVPEYQGGESQAQTQSTQHASQQGNNGIDGHLWGFLQPCNVAQARIDFWRINPIYRIGRNRQENDIVLPGFKVSEYPFLPTRCCHCRFLSKNLSLIGHVPIGNKHCRITWDGRDDRTSAVTILDLSSNGTYVRISRPSLLHTCI